LSAATPEGSRGPIPRRAPPVLLYHRIARTTRAEDPGRFAVSPAAFASQMAGLARAGFRVRPLAEIDRWSGGREAFLSFDDGYLDNYTEAFPILSRHGFSATIFVVTAHVGATSAWNGAVPLLSWSHMDEMARHGFSFQSHTRTHAVLTRCDDARAREELAGSRRELEDRLGRPVDEIAYPHGHYDDRVLRLAAEAGYRTGWAARLAGGGALDRERLLVSGRDGLATFALKASGYGDWLRRNAHRALAVVGRGQLSGSARG
jgi:peptidoglycan/xylan/chitin deacetylase (PgdA/CDA1 family)